MTRKRHEHRATGVPSSRRTRTCNSTPRRDRMATSAPDHPSRAASSSPCRDAVAIVFDGVQHGAAPRHAAGVPVLQLAARDEHEELGVGLFLPPGSRWQAPVAGGPWAVGK